MPIKPPELKQGENNSKKVIRGQKKEHRNMSPLYKGVYLCRIKYSHYLGLGGRIGAKIDNFKDTDLKMSSKRLSFTREGRPAHKRGLEQRYFETWATEIRLNRADQGHRRRS